ncbi:trans-ocimene synthase, chloroplastic-like [Typha angustifolia]|uniref:trans-ocimene synthase, chloroplastic-like n=1 Tax=Typha angustifolia TaxID=59011 RepID=UPI003C2EB471
MPCKILNKRNTRCSLQKVTRRLANYHPSIWNHELIQSMRSPFIEERFTEYLDELKFEAKSLLKACDGLSAQLQHINLMQRLGVAYHFEQEINDVFGNAYANGFEHFDDLGDSALCFRLLRQHGYYVSTDIFDRFRDENGFRSCYADDIRGLLSLYEASYIEVDEGEVLKEAREFSVRHLNQLPLDADFRLVEQVRHAMEVPLHWRRPRLEHKYFIHSYQREEGCNPLLVELAKLDYNIIQSLHLEEMKTLSWWWEELGKKLKYSRDRLLENYLWTVGIAWEPQFSKCRIILTKITSILSVVDDNIRHLRYTRRSSTLHTVSQKFAS